MSRIYNYEIDNSNLRDDQQVRMVCKDVGLHLRLPWEALDDHGLVFRGERRDVEAFAIVMDTMDIQPLDGESALGSRGRHDRRRRVVIAQNGNT